MDSEDRLGCPSDSADAGRASQCEGCPGRAMCQAMAGTDPDEALIKMRMNAIKHKILILSGKGGVGKSSVASQLAISLARGTGQTGGSKRVGVVDLDICGPSQPLLLSVRDQSVIDSEYGWKPLISPHHGIKVMSVGSLLPSDSDSVTFRGPRKTALIKRFLKDTFWGRLDFLLCDTPPGTSDEHLTVVKALKDAKPDGAVIVTTPQEVALATIRKEVNFCRKMGVRILGVIENMSGFICPCCGDEMDLFYNGGVEKFCEELNLVYLGRLPLDPSLTKSCESGDLLPEESPFTNAFQQLTTRVLNVLA